MENFNISRFGKVSKWYIANAKTGYLGFAIIAVFILLFFFIISTEVMDQKIPYNDKLETAMGIAFSFYYFLMIAIPSFMFVGMKTNQKRINYLMLPATNLEKFISRYIITLLGFTLAFIVAFFAADLLHWVFTLIRHPEQTGFVISHFTNVVSSTLVFRINNGQSSDATIVGLLCTFWVHSFYLLGGTILRKHQWIIPTGILIFLMFMGAWLIGYLLSSNCIKSINLSGSGASYVLSIITAAVTIFNYWFSYRTFKHMQVINNKWINL